jgi:hypothetical protein
MGVWLSLVADSQAVAVVDVEQDEGRCQAPARAAEDRPGLKT